MQTRRQDPENRTFRQSAFASSTEFERGIVGNLVAARCHRLTDAEEISVLWWLQGISWRDGGLEKFATDLCARHADRIGTPTMHRLGRAPERVYTADEVRAVRVELPNRTSFPLRGERAKDLDPLAGLDLGGGYGSDDSWDEARRNPESYRAERFVDACEVAASGLADTIKQALVDPASASLRMGLWYFPSLWTTLIERRDRERMEAGARLVETAVTRQIAEELDFALETRSFILLEGREGIGKSEAARVWAERNSGRAIYIRLEAGSDETTLYRSIARRVGTACTYQRKAVEMRARIQDALQGGHLMLVLDEAHFLWPQSDRSERAAPKRLDWVRTALVDFGVPVALISTPQHFSRQCDRFRKGGWNANQIQRRLVRTVALPETITAADALKVARAYFPTCPDRLLRRTAGAALLSVSRLSLFSHMRKRVDFLAARQQGAVEAELLETALDEIGAPGAAAPERKTVASALQAPRDRAASPIQESVPAPRRGGFDLATLRTDQESVLSPIGAT